MKTGVELIAAERLRQVTEEGYTAEKDQRWAFGELATAASLYATLPHRRSGVVVPTSWPFDVKYWKACPHDRVRELVKAGALLAAEIDRLQSLRRLREMPCYMCDRKVLVDAERDERDPQPVLCDGCFDKMYAGGP